MSRIILLRRLNTITSSLSKIRPPAFGIPLIGGNQRGVKLMKHTNVKTYLLAVF